MSSRRILITGGAGFIGAHLATRLSEDSRNSVTLLDNLQRGRKDAFLESLIARPNVALQEGDLLDKTSLNELGFEWDQVYHLAASLGVQNVVENPGRVLIDNAEATMRIVEWFCRFSGGRLFYASTSEAYAWTKDIQEIPVPTPESVPLGFVDLDNPRVSYAASKFYGELLVRHCCKQAEKEFVIGRFHNVYGPRMGYAHVIPQLCEKVYRANGSSCIEVFNPDHSRAFCHVDDAVKLVAMMMSEDVVGETFNVGNDEEVSIGELANAIILESEDELGVDPVEASVDMIRRRCPDVTKARSLLSYNPSVPLREGIKSVTAWYWNDLKSKEGTNA